MRGVPLDAPAARAAGVRRHGRARPAHHLRRNLLFSSFSSSSLPAAATAAAAESSSSSGPGPEDLYCLLYTSGTTGKPKGVMVPHRMVAWNAVNTVVSWQLREDDVSPIYTPLYHAGGLGAFLTPIFAVGGTIVLHAGFDAGEVLATIERERCTVALGVPTIFRMLQEHPAWASADLSSVRYFASGGAPLPLDIIETWQRRGANFKQGYGLTEVGVNCFAMSVEESVRKAGSIGRPMMFTEAKLTDEDGPRGRDRRGRRAPPARSARLQGLLPKSRGDGGRARRTGLVPHGRPREEGRGRLLHDRGAQEGHAHLGRRQRLPGRDRGRPLPAPAREGRRRRRRARTRSGARSASRSSSGGKKKRRSLRKVKRGKRGEKSRIS